MIRNDYEFISKAKDLVEDYISYQPTPQNAGDNMLGDFEVYVVWYAYILGNMKALLASTLNDDRYFEVTYSKAKNEIYIDVYHKAENIRVEIK